MICNIGCLPSAAHSSAYETLPHGIRKVFNMQTYEYEKPLKHPDYIVADLEYENRRNRVLAFNHPWIRRFRRAESLVLNIKAGNYKRIKNNVITQFKMYFGKFEEK